MSKNEIYHGEALNSPFGRIYLCPETEQIMNCSMSFKYPIDVHALKKAFSNSIMIKDPRFCSLLVRNPNGEDHWKRVRVNIDDHFVLHPTTNNTKSLGHEEEDDDENEATVNAYLADIAVSTPLSKNKPLWEVHVLVELKCVVLRVHHSLGDGVSMMSMLSSCFGQNNETKSGGINYNVKDGIGNNNHGIRKWKIGGILGLIKSMWFTLVFSLRFLGRVLGVKDKVSVVSGGDGVELWPRKLATAKFNIEDFKSIKLANPNVTVNDVLLGVISHGLSKYIDAKSPTAMRQSLQVTAIIVVNLRRNSSSLMLKENITTELIKPKSSWGNRTGFMLMPLNCCNGLHPLDNLRVVKTIMDKKKNSYEASISHMFLTLLTTFFGPKAASWCCHKVLCNTSLLISNIMGPSQQLVIANNPVTSLRVNISSQPQAITMHMVSYAGKAEIQVMVAKDIIPDPELLVKFIQDSLLEMKRSIKINLN